MKKIIFAALLSLTAILIIASCSSEVTKAKYQTEINEMVTKYIDDVNVAYSTPSDGYVFKNAGLVQKVTATDKLVTIRFKDKGIQFVAYRFSSFPLVSTYTDCVVRFKMSSVTDLKDCLLRISVSALDEKQLLDVETVIKNCMTDSKSRTALKNSLSAVAKESDYAIGNSALIMGLFSTSSDLIVKGIPSKGQARRDACTTALDLCVNYFKEVVERSTEGESTKADLLALELMESYINYYSPDFVYLLKNPTERLGAMKAEEILSKAKIIDEITGIGIAEYVTKIFIN